MLIFNKRPSPSGLGQNIPNICGIICVPANGARPEQCLANNIRQTVWSMKHKYRYIVLSPISLFETSSGVMFARALYWSDLGPVYNQVG